MSSTILEQMRSYHEIIEICERKICDELDNAPYGVSTPQKSLGFSLSLYFLL